MLLSIVSVLIFAWSSFFNPLEEWKPPLSPYYNKQFLYTAFHTFSELFSSGEHFRYSYDPF